MLVVMRHGATDRQIKGVVQAITELGCEARQLHSAQGTTVNVVGNDERIDSARLASLDGVRDIIHLSQPYQQAEGNLSGWRPSHVGSTSRHERLSLSPNHCTTFARGKPRALDWKRGYQ